MGWLHAERKLSIAPRNIVIIIRVLPHGALAGRREPPGLMVRAGACSRAPGGRPAIIVLEEGWILERTLAMVVVLV